MQMLSDERHPPIDNIDSEIKNLTTGWIPQFLNLWNEYGPLFVTALVLLAAMVSGLATINTCYIPA